MDTPVKSAPAGAPSAASPTSEPLETSERLIEAIAALEVLRDLLIAEGDPGSKYLALDGVIRSLYQIDTELGPRARAEDERPGFHETPAGEGVQS